MVIEERAPRCDVCGWIEFETTIVEPKKAVKYVPASEYFVHSSGGFNITSCTVTPTEYRAICKGCGAEYRYGTGIYTTMTA